MPRHRARQLITLIVLALTAVMSPVSMDMLTPSLTGMSSKLGASPQVVELTLYSFLIGYGVSPSLWGILSDRLGRRPVMFIGMLIYTASSLGGAIVEDAGGLVALRFIQGVGGGAGATVARAVVRDIYGASGTTRGMAQMISIMAIVPFLMPLLGGVLASIFSWRACFLAMAAIGATSLCAYYFLVPETLPVVGTREEVENPSVIDILVHPVFARYAFTNMFCISILVIFGANFAFITGNLFAFDSSHNGLVLAIFNGSIAVGTYMAGWLMSWLGPRSAVLTGAVVCTLGWLLVASAAGTGSPTPLGLAPMLILGGIGSGTIIALCSGAALTPFAHRSGTASSVYLLLQSSGSALVSLLVGLWLPKALLPIAAAMAGCGCLAIMVQLLLSRSSSRPTR